jgi:beta-phosphoglucomutase family hydrolase
MANRPRLPGGVRACLFDLDGVITQTATVHAAAWKDMFDSFLRDHAATSGGPFVPFETGRDYTAYVDDPPDAVTIHGLSNRKNALVLQHIRDDGVQIYRSSVGFVQAARSAGLRTAIVSSSANARQVLEVTGIEKLFDARVDGAVSAQRGLEGKPAPDTFLAGAADLGVRPDEAAVFEDAIAGVEAGRAGNFAFVVGIDRSAACAPARVAGTLSEHGAALLAHGADVVVCDLAELTPPAELTPSAEPTPPAVAAESSQQQDERS